MGEGCAATARKRNFEGHFRGDRVTCPHADRFAGPRPIANHIGATVPMPHTRAAQSQAPVRQLI